MNLVGKCAPVAVAVAIALLFGSSPLPLAAAPAAVVHHDVWPMTFAAAGGTIVLSEPQVRSWPKYTSLTAVAAVAVTLPGAAAPVYGTVDFSALASADVATGMVALVNPKLGVTAWPPAQASDAAALDAFVKTNLHLAGKPLLPLAMLISSIPRADRPQTVPAPVNPPVIYVNQSGKSGMAPQRARASNVPSVLVSIAGPPQFANIPGTQLRYVTNTQSDLFFSRDTTLWYLLISGRWFSAANLNGPWPFASAHLPADFKKIPESGPRGRVLVAVPGTAQSFYAMNAAQAPVVTSLDPASAKLSVSYAGGRPAFAPIAGTPLEYATNASTAIIKVSATSFFACDNGVWFTASAATGPWTAAGYVPAVIYTIPARSPLYHVTFVHIYNAQGLALTAPPSTPAPQPDDTYHNFGPSEFSNGDRSSYYITDTSGYWGYFPTYGSYSDTTYARRQAAGSDTRSIAMQHRRMTPGHGPRTTAGPGTNVYAAADGVYRYVHGAWEKNTGGTTWSAAPEAPATLRHDRRARLAGYAGTIS